jgi:hypothetical protein
MRVMVEPPMERARMILRAEIHPDLTTALVYDILSAASVK